MAEIFVGREAERSRADELIEVALGGGEAVYAIEGAPGMGKTLLAQKIVDRARASGFVVLNAGFVDGQGLPPLWPWRRILTKVRHYVESEVRHNTPGFLARHAPPMRLSLL